MVTTELLPQPLKTSIGGEQLLPRVFSLSWGGLRFGAASSGVAGGVGMDNLGGERLVGVGFGRSG